MSLQIKRPDKQIIIINDVFSKIQETSRSPLKITEAFALYFNLLLRLAWNNSVVTTGKILLNQLNREKRYMNKINDSLKCLKKSNLIDVDGENFKLNDVINIRVAIPREKYTRLRCINEQIRFLPGSPEPHHLLSVYTYLKIKENNHLNRVRVSQEKIAKDLEISVGTVRDSINLLFKVGLLNINFGNYDAARNRNECNTYKTYDFDNPIDNSKYLQIKAQIKEKKILLEDVDDANIFELLLDEDRLNIVNRLLLGAFEMCPALLIGKYAAEFRANYRKIKYDLKDVGAIAGIIDNYDGIVSLEGKYLVMDNINFLNRPNQDRLLLFVENSELPIVLLADYEKITPTLFSRMKFVFKDPLKKEISADRLPPHKALEITSKFKGQQHKMNYLAERSPKAYCLEHYQAGRDKGQQNIDSLISQLSGGKTFREIDTIIK